MKPFHTAELCDAHVDVVRSCATQLRQFGGLRSFCGPIRTVRTVSDNVLMREALGSPVQGEVLVVDAGGYLDAAVLGDQMAALGLKNGWAGVVIHGAVRDVNALAAMSFGVKALGTNPRRCNRTGVGERDVEISFGGVAFRPGAWIYCDDDGIVVAPQDLR